MIHRVTIANPINWMEKESKDVKDSWIATSIFPSSADDFSHELFVPEICDRSFTFKDGLNIVVGPNGSGKTSLLKLISDIVCCNGSNSSSFDYKRVYNVFNGGEFACCEVKADYDISSFHLLGEDNTSGKKDISIEIAELKSKDKSTGQGRILRIKSLLDYFNEDGKVLQGDSRRNLCDFRKMVCDPLNAMAAKTKSTMLELVSGYYAEHSVTTEGDKKPVTFMMDCPDDGLDLPNLKLLYNLLLDSMRKKDKFQFIVSLNSSILVQSIVKISGVNWIDLVPGYLKELVGRRMFLPVEVEKQLKAERTEKKEAEAGDKKQ